MMATIERPKTDTPAAPVIACRNPECGCTLKAEWQPPIVATKPGYFILTCNKNPDCYLYQQTFTTKSYDTVDLSQYRK